MKRKLLLIGLVIWNLNSVFSQICGTEIPSNPTYYPTEKNNSNASKRGSSSAICVNIIFHIVRNTNGTNAFTLPNTNNIITELNEVYSPHNIIFNNLGTDFIDSDSYVDLSRSEAESLDNINNRSDALNYNIVDNLWDNVAGVVINGLPNRNLFIEDQHVLNFVSPHEVGHCLNLYHTFETDFGHERTDGLFCTTTGDLVCDTPADNRTGATNGYNPDMTNIMSYYHLSPWFNNLDHFTDGQGFRMRGALSTESILINTRSNSCTQISEVSTICYPQTTIVSLSNLGGATTVWSSSNNVQIVSSNNSSATIRGANSYSNGDGWIRVVLSNGITFQENFHVGKADVDNVLFRNNGAGVNGYFCSSHFGNEFEILPYVPNASYEIRIRDLSTNNIVAGPYNFTGGIATLPTNYNYTPGWYLFEAKGTNTCGIGSWTQWEVEFVDCTHGGGGGESEYRIYPNPSSENLTIQNIKSSKEKNSNKASNSNNSAFYKIFDFSSNLIFKGFIVKITTIDVSEYKKGNYILKIYKNGKSESHQIIIN